MPKDRLEELLKRSARRRGIHPDTDRYRAYVYGTLREIKKRKKRTIKKEG